MARQSISPIRRQGYNLFSVQEQHRAVELQAWKRSGLVSPDRQFEQLDLISGINPLNPEYLRLLSDQQRVFDEYQVFSPANVGWLNKHRWRYENASFEEWTSAVIREEVQPARWYGLTNRMIDTFDWQSDPRLFLPRGVELWSWVIACLGYRVFIYTDNGFNTERKGIDLGREVYDPATRRSTESGDKNYKVDMVCPTRKVAYQIKPNTFLAPANPAYKRKFFEAQQANFSKQLTLLSNFPEYRVGFIFKNDLEADRFLPWSLCEVAEKQGQLDFLLSKARSMNVEEERLSSPLI